MLPGLFGIFFLMKMVSFVCAPFVHVCVFLLLLLEILEKNRLGWENAAQSILIFFFLLMKRNLFVLFRVCFLHPHWAVSKKTSGQRSYWHLHSFMYFYECVYEINVSIFLINFQEWTLHSVASKLIAQGPKVKPGARHPDISWIREIEL